MQEMLCALNHRRSARLLSNVHESFHAKETCAEVLRDPVQKKLRFLPYEWALACENEILYSPAFEMVAVCVARMIVFMTIIFVMMIVAARDVITGCILMGFHIEPTTGIRLRVGRVEPRTREELRDHRRRPIDLRDLGRRVYPAEMEPDAR